MLSLTAYGPLGMASEPLTSDQLDRLAALDEAAWQSVFDQHFVRVRNFAYARLGDAGEAEDVAAEVFTAALRGIKGFRDRGAPFPAWLFRIARNITADHLRRRSRTPQTSSDFIEPEAPAFEYLQVEDRDELMRAIQRLTEDQQTVIGLRFFADCSIEDTARSMSKSEGAVKLLQQRALASLRRHLTAKGVGR